MRIIVIKRGRTRRDPDGGERGAVACREKHDVKVTPAPVSRARARSPEAGRTPDRRAPAALVLNEIEFSRHRITFSSNNALNRHRRFMCL